MPNKRTLQQNRIIHSLLNKFDFTADDKAELVFDITRGRTESTKEMYQSEADVMIKRLGGTKPVSRRTENHRKQEAGIKTVPSAKQKKFLLELWLIYPHRTERNLELICLNTLGHEHPQTVLEASKMIEAVKSMNLREKKNRTKREELKKKHEDQQKKEAA